MRHPIRSFTLAIMLLLTSLAAAQQSPAPFTVDDLLDVASVSAADLSDDGRWLAATTATLRDRLGIDKLMTGEQDHNVPARQAMEMYYALRRLDKKVEWVSYTNGGHGLPTSTVEEVKDYPQRIVKWYDDHLKGDLKKKAEDAKAEGGQQ
jgi:dipeptidyl aminopeptidase/acylaminoacyl peptidase